MYEFFDLDEGKYSISNTILRYLERTRGLDSIKKASIRVHLVMYYSPNDLNIAFGFDPLKMAYITSPNFVGRPYISKKRSLNGYIYSLHSKHYGHVIDSRVSYKIVDLYGWSNGGLEELANSLSISLPDKNLSKVYGKKMLRLLLEHPQSFLTYSKRDVTSLLEILFKQTELVNRIASDILNIDLKFTAKTIPYTLGALVNTIFESWILSKGGIALELAIRKLGMINPVLKLNHKQKIQRLHNELLYNEDPLREYRLNEDKYSPLFNHSSYAFLAYSNCSVQNFLMESYKTNAHVGAIVYGGRCHNERPYNFTASHTIDIDISSAYGSALKTLEYPLGNPKIVTSTHNQTSLTLGEFLELYGEELVDGLYTIYVSGELPFRQDLLYSKDISETSFANVIQKVNQSWVLSIETSKEYGVFDRDDTAHIPSDTILSRMELKHAVLTSDMIDLLKKIPTNIEWKALKETKVDTAIFYSKKDRIDSVDDWAAHVLKDTGTLHFDVDQQTPVDTRTNAWCSLPFAEFLDPLITQRQQTKQEALVETDSGRKRELMALQKTLKLVVNTLYGVITSPYFGTNNTIVANNTTAYTRRAIWMLAKALNIFQTITDGGMFSVMKVLAFKPTNQERRPGLSSFTDIRFLEKHRSIQQIPLGNRDWLAFFKELFEQRNFSDVDELALQHVREFYKAYDLEFQYNKLEHKPEHTAIKMFYLRKADNAVLVADDEGKFSRIFRKTRGIKHNETHPHPLRIMLDEGLMGDDNPKLPTTEFVDEQIVSPSDYKRMHTKAQIEANEIQCIPGHSVSTVRHVKFHNTHYPVDTIKEYKQRLARIRKKVPIEFTQRAVKYGFQHANIAMEHDNPKYVPEYDPVEE